MSIKSKIQSLIAAANSKTGESDTTLTDAVQTLVDGYGQGGGDYVAADWFDKTKPTGVVTTSINLSSIPKYMLAYHTGITGVIAPNATWITDNTFEGCTGLVSIQAPNVTGIGGGAFNGCTHLEWAVFPKLVIVYTLTMSGCSALKGIDFGGSPASNQGFSRNNSFNNCSALKTIVLRGSNVWPLSGGIGAFSGTPFASGKSGGTLYVPASLISSYQSATNWSTILGYSTNSIKSIESTATDPNAPLDLTTHYADGSLIPTT